MRVILEVERWIAGLAILVCWCIAYSYQSKLRTRDVLERMKRGRGILASAMTRLPPKKYLDVEQAKLYDLCVLWMYIATGFFVLCVLLLRS